MRNQIVGLFVALLGIGAAACDGLEVSDGSEGGELGVASGAWSAKEYPPAKDGVPYVAWSIGFESQSDIDSLDVEQACGSERQGPYCPAVEPATEALAKAGQWTVCGEFRSQVWRDGPAGCQHVSHCQTCCTWIVGTTRVTCETKCERGSMC